MNFPAVAVHSRGTSVRTPEKEDTKNTPSLSALSTKAVIRSECLASLEKSRLSVSGVLDRTPALFAISEKEKAAPFALLFIRCSPLGMTFV